jgi:hypothetical protein
MMAFDRDKDLGRVQVHATPSALPPAPPAGAHHVGLIGEDHLARLGMLGCARSQVGASIEVKRWIRSQ